MLTPPGPFASLIFAQHGIDANGDVDYLFWVADAFGRALSIAGLLHVVAYPSGFPTFHAAPNAGIVPADHRTVDLDALLILPPHALVYAAAIPPFRHHLRYLPGMGPVFAHTRYRVTIYPLFAITESALIYGLRFTPPITTVYHDKTIATRLVHVHFAVNGRDPAACIPVFLTPIMWAPPVPPPAGT